MRDKALLENGGALKYVPYFYKNQEISNKVVENQPHSIKFGSECCKTQKICDKAVNTYTSKNNLKHNNIKESVQQHKKEDFVIVEKLMENIIKRHQVVSLKAPHEMMEIKDITSN